MVRRPPPARPRRHTLAHIAYVAHAAHLLHAPAAHSRAARALWDRRARAATRQHLRHNTAFLAIVNQYRPGPAKRAVLSAAANDCDCVERIQAKMNSQFFRSPYDFLFGDDEESVIYDDVPNFPQDLITGLTVDMPPPINPLDLRDPFGESDSDDEGEPLGDYATPDSDLDSDSDY